jgi:hypothetical protein
MICKKNVVIYYTRKQKNVKKRMVGYDLKFLWFLKMQHKIYTFQKSYLLKKIKKNHVLGQL